MHHDFEPAYVLHSRPYRNTSAIADFLTLNHGRISGVVKGVFGKSRAAQQQRGVLQPLQPLLINWQGRSELKNINKIELAGAPCGLHGTKLYSALYVNELLMRTLQNNDPNSYLFGCYQTAMTALINSDYIDTVLRDFELSLLQELGYGLHFDVDVSGSAIEEEYLYRFDVRQGFIPQSAFLASKQSADSFSGKVLLGIHVKDWKDDLVRRDAKRLLRQALRVHIGVKPLLSRGLFKKR